MTYLPTDTVFYYIEKAIKSYRKFAQKNIENVELNITVDQALVLMLISNNPDLTQIQIADILFKDYASITRMIDLMVNRKYLKRKPSEHDRRRSNLALTKKGDLALANILPIISQNRKMALKDVTKEEQEFLKEILDKIIKNCTLDEFKSNYHKANHDEMP